jgi:MFS family permease
MSFPFYVLYATDTLAVPDQTIGVFIFAQTVGASLASLFLGRLADRQGAQRVIVVGTIVAITAPILALAFALGGLTLRWAYVWIYICIGLVDNLIMLGYLNYLLDIAPPGQRTIYMGTFSAIGAIGVLGPTIAGWLLGLTSYSFLFAISLGFGLLTLAVMARLPRVRDNTPAAGAP